MIYGGEEVYHIIFSCVCLSAHIHLLTEVMCWCLLATTGGGSGEASGARKAGDPSPHTTGTQQTPQHRPDHLWREQGGVTGESCTHTYCTPTVLTHSPLLHLPLLHKTALSMCLVVLPCIYERFTIFLWLISLNKFFFSIKGQYTAFQTASNNLMNSGLLKLYLG